MRISIAMDKKQEIFDWRTVPAVNPEDLAMWKNATDAVERQFPLQLALQVHDELEAVLMREGKLDALALSEIRGGIKALARFAQIYSKVLGGSRGGGDFNAEEQRRRESGVFA